MYYLQSLWRCLALRVGKSPEDCQPWQRDWLDQYGEAPLGVARPKSTAEVSEVIRFCRAEGVPVVPQGGNTGHVGGGVLGEPGGVIVTRGGRL